MYGIINLCEHKQDFINGKQFNTKETNLSSVFRLRKNGGKLFHCVWLEEENEIFKQMKKNSL